MKAVIYRKYGSPDVVRLEEIERPVPKDGEILVQVRAASLNPWDLHFLSGTPLFMRLTEGGLLKPELRPLGADMAGTVEAVGPGVGEFKAGDEVYGCYHGSLAEYACGPADRFAPKPTNLSFAEAAAVPMAALTALQGLRDKGRIRTGQRVLVNGASGGVGSFAVQLAKMFGTEVTATCRPFKTEFVRSLGADAVVDYTREDVTKSGQPFDLIFDTAAYRSVLRYRRILKPGGMYVLAGGAMARIAQVAIISKIVNKNMMFMIAKVDRGDLLILKDDLEAGRIRPFIDKIYPLSEAAAAFWRLKKGQAQGKVVVTVGVEPQE